MGRKRVIDPTDLLVATEELLLEVGYHAFNFKLLSQKLRVARSTLYEYYPNKEELITSYMLQLMERILNECECLNEIESPMDQLHQILLIFIKYSQVHQVMPMTSFIDGKASPTIKTGLVQLTKDHYRLYNQITQTIEECKQRQLIDASISTSIIAGLIYNSILIPNKEQLPKEEFTKQLFSVIKNGIKAKIVDTHVENIE
ncbi:TetR/AcrR family transcriptional regulator [Hazenella coriacea]|uniref:TetR family transcriptional regulator n=1 Tax=Hazenella coriacea TaxID=1179467 RepID=A0A4R3L9Y7_9BACL|nr:TetR/AcrR family transcriptional regulator [Hazenella coriacea]TCS95054.1 TetR family transcriptional regulator [Hazenella coriacea]